MTTRKNTKRSKKCTKKNKKHTKNYTKRSKKYTKGGNNNSCLDSDVKCNFLDKHFQGKINPTWNTCINMNGIYNHIVYITPTNVLIKSIESLQIPEFYVKFPNDSISKKCNIMIEDKYIGCFLYICGEWYAIMRLFGKTLNTQYFARTEKNKAFYKLKNIYIDVDTTSPENSGDGSILLPIESYSEVNNSKILATNNLSLQIKLSENYFTNINKNNDKNVFNVLQRFRQEKLYANNVKQEFAQEAAKNVIFGFLG